MFFKIIRCAFLFSIFILYSNGCDAFVYDARVNFNALNLEARCKLEGIDPAQSIDAIEEILGKYVDQDLWLEMKNRIQTLRKSLLSAREQYQECNSLVGHPEETAKANKIACQLASDVEHLSSDPSHPPILFIGGHYWVNENGSMVGHTATYEVIRQENGSLSFIVNNTIPDGIHHEISENKIRQLVYNDLKPTDLDVSFWENVIQMNYMNLAKGKFMDPFYTYLDNRLLKIQKNKTFGRSYKKQNSGVCAWKSITVWLHGKIAKGDFREDRNSTDEGVYVNFKKLLFETMLKSFDSNEIPDGMTVQYGSQVEPASIFLKRELERKIDRLRVKEKIIKNI